MGLFLSMSGVLGAKTAEVESTLKTFCVDRKGKFEAKKLGTDERNCLVLREDKGGCSLLYPNNFMDWDEASKFISRELQKPVFSFHIHDGDLWMYLFFVNGEQKDQFNPIPQYWDEDEDPEPWAGDAKKLAAAIPGLKAEDVAKYLVPWDLDAEESEKAIQMTSTVPAKTGSSWILCAASDSRTPVPKATKLKAAPTTLKHNSNNFAGLSSPLYCVY